MKLTPEQYNEKIEALIAQTQLPNQYWSADLQQLHDAPIESFIRADQYLPSMSDSGDWYTSRHYLLLVERKSQQGSELIVESGFLAKWKDEDYLFWYENDAIEKVIGWMPMPEINFSPKALKNTGSWL